jgi:2-oxoacid:acceptor oxidoreductase delta subunit (pyruvate/2-ketoisovalerate family)
MSESNQNSTDPANEKSWEIVNKSRKERPLVQHYCGIEELPPIPISFPQKGSIGRTGDWRTYVPVLKAEKCTKCGQCYLFCPEGTIELDEKTGCYIVDIEYCKGCGICAKQCPVQAIDMVLEEK